MSTHRARRRWGSLGVFSPADLLAVLNDALLRRLRRRPRRSHTGGVGGRFIAAGEVRRWTVNKAVEVAYSRPGAGAQDGSQHPAACVSAMPSSGGAGCQSEEGGVFKPLPGPPVNQSAWGIGRIAHFLAGSCSKSLP